MAEAVAKEDYTPPPKKARVEHRIDTTQLDHSDTVDSTTDRVTELAQDQLFTTFQDFEVMRVLSSSEEQKTIAVEGRLAGREGTAVVMLQKLPFSSEKLQEIFSDSTSLKMLFRNDVYYNKLALMPAELNEIKATIIYPAEEKHILRFEKQSSSFVDETPELYQEVTRPYIESSSFSKEWIYNILEHKKEADRIVFEDPDPDLGFILLPDLKWTGEQVEDLYLQAIIHRKDITSLRDLRATHIPLLKNIYNKGTIAIKEKYGIGSHKLRVYLHYQPSFYHLHVHFTALSFDAPGTWAGKAHLLPSVISNLEVCADFYSRAILSFTVKDNHPLRAKFKAKGYFTE